MSYKPFYTSTQSQLAPERHDMSETKPFCEAVTRSDCPIGTGQYVLLIGGARAGVIDGGYRQTIVTAVNAHDKLLEACQAIATLGGNLPDERLTDKTGPNDARGRGLMYVEARRIARAAIAAAEGR